MSDDMPPAGAPPISAKADSERGSASPDTQAAFGEILAQLKTSEFRARFSLSRDLQAYARRKGLLALQEHAERFISERLAPAQPFKDGKQTPMKGHPVFLAQHACACCCRSCLEKWHHIPKGRPLSEPEKAFIIALLLAWISQKTQGSLQQEPNLEEAPVTPRRRKGAATRKPAQLSLF
ncbi:DUF4186 domain-containing protein [Oecophyllibacter saccharovorans]|nr:DUF4186 domain-containing protein [Oecophyllibacter saccharovorans]